CAKATTRPTAPGRSRAPFKSESWIPWRSASSKGNSVRSTSFSGTPRGMVGRSKRECPSRHNGLVASTKPSPRLKPRGGDRRQRTFGGRPAASLWYGLAFLLLLVLVQAYYLTPAARTVPYSEFKELVKQGALEEATAGDQFSHATLKARPADDPKQAKQFATTRVDDPKLTEELEAHGVKYSGEVVNRWLPELLSWIIPLLFIVGIWGLFFRRMSGAEGGVMSFARSRAKAYADDEVK